MRTEHILIQAKNINIIGSYEVYFTPDSHHKMILIGNDSTYPRNKETFDIYATHAIGLAFNKHKDSETLYRISAMLFVCNLESER